MSRRADLASAAIVAMAFLDGMCILGEDEVRYTVHGCAPCDGMAREALLKHGPPGEVTT